MPRMIIRTFAGMKDYRYLLLIIISLSCVCATAQNRMMTIEEVDSLAALRNLQLKALHQEVDAAEGQLSQARKYENPEVQVMHNIQNPNNRRWFDMGYDGQTDVQISQSIAIGGQYKNKVRQAKASLNASKAGYQAEMLNVRQEACITFIELYNAQQKLKVFDKEIASVEKIHQAYDEQTSKGNVSKMEIFRIAAMLSQLRAEKTELQLCVNNLQSQLRLLLNLQEDTPIRAYIDEESAIRSIAEQLVEMAQTMPSTLQKHPEMLQAKYLEESAQYAVKVEKAEALPRISLNGEWDKNGSIGHNFFAVGATVSVPLWNRNQGNIRSAKAQSAQASIERQQRENELRASLQNHYQATLQNLKLVEDQKKHLSTDLDQLLCAAEDQFLKRNISVLEFVDLYSSYRGTHFMLEDAKAQLFKSNEEMKKYTR